MVLHLKWAKELRQEGKRLGRAGMSARVIQVVDEFYGNGPSYKGAMILAGRLKAIAQAAKSDGYWDEQVSKGFHREMGDLRAWETHMSICDEAPDCETDPAEDAQKEIDRENFAAIKRDQGLRR